MNADGYASTGQGILGINMFAYCLNNPINFYDPFGSYVVEFPAEGPGEMVIRTQKGDPDITTSHYGNTYVVEVQPRKSASRQIIEAINGEVVQEVATGAIESLGNLQYQNYVRITFSDATSAVLTNAGRACNNIAYTTLGPYLNDMKIAGGSLVTVAAFGFDVYMDYCKYGGNSSDFYKAATITAAATAVGTIVGVAITAAFSPVAAPLACVCAGAIISIGEEYAKKKMIGY